MEKVHLDGKMGRFTKDNGEMVIWMEKDNLQKVMLISKGYFVKV